MASQKKSPGAELTCLQSRPLTNWKHLMHHTIFKKIYQRRPRRVEQLEFSFGPECDNIPTKTTNNWSPQDLQQVLEVHRLLLKQRGLCHSEQHVLLPSNLKLPVFSPFTWNSFLVSTFELFIMFHREWIMESPNHCIQFLFTFYTTSQLFQNQACKHPLCHHFSTVTL